LHSLDPPTFISSIYQFYGNPEMIFYLSPQYDIPTYGAGGVLRVSEFLAKFLGREFN